MSPIYNPPKSSGGFTEVFIGASYPFTSGTPVNFSLANDFLITGSINNFLYVTLAVQIYPPSTQDYAAGDTFGFTFNAGGTASQDGDHGVNYIQWPIGGGSDSMVALQSEDSIAPYDASLGNSNMQIILQDSAFANCGLGVPVITFSPSQFAGGILPVTINITTQTGGFVNISQQYILATAMGYW